jgi:hypothetical protein
MVILSSNHITGALRLPVCSADQQADQQTKEKILEEVTVVQKRGHFSIHSENLLPVAQDSKLVNLFLNDAV